MPRVITPGTSGPDAPPPGSPVAPAVQSAPCPRVSTTSCALATIAYGVAVLLPNGNGLIAVFVCAIVLSIIISALTTLAIGGWLWDAMREWRRTAGLDHGDDPRRPAVAVPRHRDAGKPPGRQLEPVEIDAFRHLGHGASGLPRGQQDHASHHAVLGRLRQQRRQAGRRVRCRYRGAE